MAKNNNIFINFACWTMVEQLTVIAQNCPQDVKRLKRRRAWLRAERRVYQVDRSDADRPVALATNDRST